MKLRAKRQVTIESSEGGWFDLSRNQILELNMDDFKVVEGHQVCCCGQHVEKEITKEDYKAIKETLVEALHKPELPERIDVKLLNLTKEIVDNALLTKINQILDYLKAKEE